MEIVNGMVIVQAWIVPLYACVTTLVALGTGYTVGKFVERRSWNRVGRLPVHVVRPEPKEWR